MTAPTNEPLHDDDPRLTAYALSGDATGEVPPDERALVEAYLRDHAEARRFVEETRAAAAQLEREFAALPVAESLRPAQRAAVLAQAASRSAPALPRAKGRALRLTTWPTGIAAAAAALVVGVTFSQRHEIGRWWTGEEREVAGGRALRRSTRGFDFDEAPGRGVAERSNPSRARQSEARAAAAELSQPPLDPSADPAGTTARYGDDACNPGVLTGLQPAPGDVPAAATPPAPPVPTPPVAGGPPSGPAPAPAPPPAKASGPRPVEVPHGAQGGLGGSMGSGTYYDFGAAGGGGDARPDGVEPGNTKNPGRGGGGGGAPGGSVEKELAEHKKAYPPSPTGSGAHALGGGGDASSKWKAPAPAEPPPADGRLSIGAQFGSQLHDLPFRLGKDGALPRVALVADGTAPAGSTPVLTLLAADGKSSQPVSLGDAPVLGYLLKAADNGQIHLDAEVRRVLEIRIRESQTQGAKDSPENYAELRDNDFTKVADAPLSTFGTDVDTASYSNVRRFLRNGQLPPPGAVRIEEMLNYFPYQYAAPSDGEAFAVHADVAGCPWNTTNRLVRIALKGREVDFAKRPPANLVFLIDVSGSMRPENKLPLLVQSMKLLVEKLDEGDRLSIVVYAGASGLALAPTTGDRKGDILAALDRLQAGGSTNGAAGIELAYQTAAAQFIPGGINRVILATDGDFNVGVSDESSLVRLIEEKAKSKVFLSVLGFGEGNLQDAKMEKLADKGNGNYAYVDSLREGRKVLVEQAAGTLMTIAKDVKVQVEFNPLRVASYRLIGYENRVMAAQDFADDRKDAGDVGAGHAVTALYEIVPAGTTTAPATEPLRYQTPPAPAPTASSNELLNVKLRWKLPEGDVSTLRERPVTDTGASYAASSPDFKFAASVAAFGMLLRNSPHRGNATFDAVLELATEGLAFDPDGHRAEFVDLVRATKSLAGR